LIKIKTKPKLKFWLLTAAESLLAAVAVLFLHQLAPSDNANIQMIKIKVIVFFLIAAAFCLLVSLLLVVLWAVSKRDKGK